MPSSPLWVLISLEMLSCRLSEDCDKSLAFWADPRMPSLLKLGARTDLSDEGDLSACTPLLEATICWGGGISMVKSRFGTGNCLTILAWMPPPVMVPTESGESPLDDGDMLLPFAV